MKTLKIVIENNPHARANWVVNEEDLNQYVDFEFQIEDDFKPFDHTFIIDGKYCSPCRLDLKENILVVKEFEMQGSEDDETFENVLTCPVCGHIYHDCWELPRDFADDFECPTCKSILEYEREYTTKVKKISEPYKLEEQKC